MSDVEFTKHTYFAGWVNILKQYFCSDLILFTTDDENFDNDNLPPKNKNEFMNCMKMQEDFYRRRLKIPIDWDIEMYYTPPGPPQQGQKGFSDG